MYLLPYSHAMARYLEHSCLLGGRSECWLVSSLGTLILHTFLRCTRLSCSNPSKRAQHLACHSLLPFSPWLLGVFGFMKGFLPPSLDMASALFSGLEQLHSYALSLGHSRIGGSHHQERRPNNSFKPTPLRSGVRHGRKSLPCLPPPLRYAA